MSYADYLINAALVVAIIAGGVGAIFGFGFGMARLDSRLTAWPLLSLSGVGLIVMIFAIATISYRGQS